MARPLRFAFPGAIYRVTSRGNAPRGRREAAGVSRPGGGSGRALPLAVGSGRSRPLFAGGSARGRRLALGLGEGLDPTAD